MKPSEYLDAAKTRMGITSDYELAKRLEVPRNHLPEIRKGKRPLTPYLCTRIAVALDLDPAAVIADIQAQTEKNPKRAAFWRSFLSRVAVLAVLYTLASSFTNGFGPDQPGNGGGVAIASSLIMAGLWAWLLRIMCIMSNIIHRSADRPMISGHPRSLPCILSGRAELGAYNSMHRSVHTLCS